jgi:hypothetical protein
MPIMFATASEDYQRPIVHCSLKHFQTICGTITQAKPARHTFLFSIAPCLFPVVTNIMRRKKVQRYGAHCM